MTGTTGAFPAVVVGDVRILVHRELPGAVLRGPEGDRVVSWPDLDVGWAVPAVRLIPAPDGVWVHYGVMNSTGEDDPLATFVNAPDAPVVHLRADGTTDVVRIGTADPLGATTEGLWTHPGWTLRTDETYRGEPLPEGWAEPDELTVHRLDGSTRRVSVDRHVFGVIEDDGPVLLLHPSPPVATPEPYGGTAFDYREALVRIPPDATEVRFRELVPDGWGEQADLPALADRLPRHGWDGEDDAAPLQEVPAWALAAVPPEVAALGVEHLRRQFTDIEAYWHGQDGAAEPLSRGLHDGRVDALGDWPATRVMVSFRHPSYPGGRLRRVLPVFDGAGRIRVDPYAAIWLMEDLDTRHLPPPEQAVGGVLDV